MSHDISTGFTLILHARGGAPVHGTWPAAWRACAATALTQLLRPPESQQQPGGVAWPAWPGGTHGGGRARMVRCSGLDYASNDRVCIYLVTPTCGAR